MTCREYIKKVRDYSLAFLNFGMKNINHFKYPIEKISFVIYHPIKVGRRCEKGENSIWNYYTDRRRICPGGVKEKSEPMNFWIIWG